MERRLAAILAADVVGYSRLIRADEEGTLDRLKALRNEIIVPKVAEHNGRIVKFMGDGMLAEFASVVDAVRAAIEAQKSITEHNAGWPEKKRIVFRIGINLGDVVIDDDDIQGDGVNVAARLEGLAEPGGICVSGSVYDQVRDRVDAPFEDMGKQEVKNIDRPVRVWRWAADTPTAAPGSKKESEPLSLPDKPSIAVLPFLNMSNDPEQDFFSDGISEDIITDLSKVSNLYVSSRNSSFVFKGAAVNIEQAASKLRVRYILEGSVRKVGDRVRITAQLVDGDSGGHIWAERYDRHLENIFDVQDEIAGRIVNALKVKISPSEERAIEKRPTQDVDAYQQYLRGRSFLREMTRKSVELAVDMFKSAVEIDPQYAQAFAGLAESECTLADHYDVPPGVMEDAVKNSRRALEIDPALAEAHASLGWVLSLLNRREEAESQFQKAIELSPHLFEAHFYLASMYLTSRQFDKAVPLIRRAYELADHDLQAGMMLMCTYRGAGDVVQCKNIARRVFEVAKIRSDLNPEDETATYVGAFALLEMGELDKAKSWAEIAVAVASEDSRQRYNLACLLSLLGQTEQAIDQIRLVLAEIRGNDRKIEWMRYNDPDLDKIRDDPRFVALFDI